MSNATRFTLRRAMRADARGFIRLVIALAKFEHLDPPNRAAQARLVKDSLGPKRRFEPWLAFVPGRRQPVGYAIVLETYSSFLARPTLYLEDLFVLPEFRGHGLGRALFQNCIKLANQRGCGRMEWTCLDWNTKAQCFYHSIGARRMSDWYLYRLTRNQLQNLAADGGASAHRVWKAGPDGRTPRSAAVPSRSAQAKRGTRNLRTPIDLTKPLRLGTAALPAHDSQTSPADRPPRK